MATVAISIFKTLSKKQVARLQKLGASISNHNKTLTATETQMWGARIIGNTRRLLEKRGNLAISAKGHNFP